MRLINLYYKVRLTFYSYNPAPLLTFIGKTCQYLKKYLARRGEHRRCQICLACQEVPTPATTLLPHTFPLSEHSMYFIRWVRPTSIYTRTRPRGMSVSTWQVLWDCSHQQTYVISIKIFLSHFHVRFQEKSIKTPPWANFVLTFYFPIHESVA